jgi:adenylate cyclase class 2
VQNERRETEIKLSLKDAETGRLLLEGAGFHVSRARVFESNLVLDSPDGRLRRGGMLLRVRESGGKAMFTFKGPSLPSRHKDREEIEIGVSSVPDLCELLQRLGYLPAWRYDKFRTEFHRAGAQGHACLDETPIGVYLELEGKADWIDATAGELGFTERDYILRSYGGLYSAHCERTGMEPGNMVFNQEAGSNSQPNPGLSEGRV